MYQRLIEEYLRYYHPRRRARLMYQGQLQHYLESQDQMMKTTRQQLLDDLKQHSPQISRTQMELEVDQQLRAMFLPLS